MHDQQRSAPKQPYAVLGAGDLVSHLHRECGGGDIASYYFNVFRTTASGRVTHSIRPADLRSIVKLCQVLSFTIADDGWLRAELRQELFELAESLDRITQAWDEEQYGSQTTP